MLWLCIMDNKDYSELLLQNINRSLPSSKIKDYWQACGCSRGFSRTQSRETIPWIYFSPTNERRNCFQLLMFQCWVPKLLSGHQTTLPTVHSGQSTHDLDCTMTELHLEGWKGWAYEYRNSWAICNVNRIIYCNLIGTTWFHADDTKLGIGVQPNYPQMRYVGLCPTNLPLALLN